MEELILELPQGFSKSDEFSEAGITSYYGSQYPQQLSNVNIFYEEKDGSIADMTMEALQEDLRKQYRDAYGEDAAVEFLDFRKHDIDGRTAFYIEQSYVLRGNEVKQVQVLLESSESIYFVTYTDLDGGIYMDAFRESADTVKLDSR